MVTNTGTAVLVPIILLQLLQQCKPDRHDHIGQIPLELDIVMRAAVPYPILLLLRQIFEARFTPQQQDDARWYQSYSYNCCCTRNQHDHFGQLPLPGTAWTEMLSLQQYHPHIPYLHRREHSSFPLLPGGGYATSHHTRRCLRSAALEINPPSALTRQEKKRQAFKARLATCVPTVPMCLPPAPPSAVLSPTPSEPGPAPWRDRAVS